MASTDVKVRLDNAALARLTLPGGMVSRRIDRISGEIALLARLNAPKRTGRLAASIESGQRFANQYGCTFRVKAGASYASYVLHGTGGRANVIRPGFIRDPLGRFAQGGRGWFHLPPGGGYPWVWTRKVHGQNANDFLGRAAKEVLARYGL